MLDELDTGKADQDGAIFEGVEKELRERPHHRALMAKSLEKLNDPKNQGKPVPPPPAADEDGDEAEVEPPEGADGEAAQRSGARSGASRPSLRRGCGRTCGCSRAASSGSVSSVQCTTRAACFPISSA